MAIDLYMSIGLVIVVSSFFGAYIGGFIMKSYIISSKKVFRLEVETFSRMNAEFISKFQDDVLKIGQKTTIVQEQIDSNLENINQKMIVLNSYINNMNSKFNRLNELENEIIKYKKIIKRMEKKIV